MLNKRQFRAALAQAGFTQKALAKEIGVTENTMSAKVNGPSCFDTDQIDKICTVLEITDDAKKAQIFLSQSSQNRDDPRDYLVGKEEAK